MKQIIIITVLFILLIIGSRWFLKKDISASPGAIKKLIRQTSRWAVASTQDENPLIALLHANYATGYLSALKEIATVVDIQKAMGPSFDIQRFYTEIGAVQDDATIHLIKQCNYVPKNQYLARLAKEFY